MALVKRPHSSRRRGRRRLLVRTLEIRVREPLISHLYRANYFLMHYGEFSLALIREIERLKTSHLTGRSGNSMVIKEQDLHHALLRASVGTSAQVDPLLSHLKFELPSGVVRPLLPTLIGEGVEAGRDAQPTRFDDILLGSPLKMTYEVDWPLNLFLQTQDLTVYAEVFSFLSSLRYIHMRIHTCWSSLSNSQRARRRWTGLNEGGTLDSRARMELLRCGWGIVRLMGWFMDVLLGYVMNDVVESEFRLLKKQLKFKDYSNKLPSPLTRTSGISDVVQPSYPASPSLDSVSPTKLHQLDFTTLRNFHTAYLHRLRIGCLHTQPAIMSTIREIFDVCERFMGRVERWGGDVLPALLFEGSISTDETDSIGKLVQERWEVVKGVDEVCPSLRLEINGAAEKEPQDIRTLLDKLYDQLSTTTSQLLGGPETSVLVPDTNTAGAVHTKRTADNSNEMETRRHVERLLLYLDFNGSFSKPRPGEVIGSPSSGGI